MRNHTTKTITLITTYTSRRLHKLTKITPLYKISEREPNFPITGKLLSQTLAIANVKFLLVFMDSKVEVRYKANKFGRIK